MRRLAALLTIACAVLLVACGGSTKKSGSSSAPPPKPAETVAAYGARLQAAMTALESGKCQPIQQLNATAGFAFACTAQGRKQYKGFKVTGSEAFGTGGVVEATDAEVKSVVAQPGVKSNPRDQREVIVVAIGPSGKYSATGPIVPVEPATSIGTKPASLGDQDARAKAFLDSIRTHDCAKFFRYSLTPGVKSAQDACKNILDKYYSRVATQLKSQKDAKPVFLGGNGAVTFYGVRTGKQYRTLSVLKGAPRDPEPYLVLGTSRGPGG
jgi:hypothetical protein